MVSGAVFSGDDADDFEDTLDFGDCTACRASLAFCHSSGIPFGKGGFSEAGAKTYGGLRKNNKKYIIKFTVKRLKKILSTLNWIFVTQVTVNY